MLVPHRLGNISRVYKCQTFEVFRKPENPVPDSHPPSSKMAIRLSIGWWVQPWHLDIHEKWVGITKQQDLQHFDGTDRYYSLEVQVDHQITGLSKKNHCFSSKFIINNFTGLSSKWSWIYRLLGGEHPNFFHRKLKACGKVFGSQVCQRCF